MPDNVSSKPTVEEANWLSISTAKGRSWFHRSGVGGQLVALVIVMAIFAIGTKGRYLSAANLQVILSLAAIRAIIAIGLHQVVILGGIDLSVEGVVAWCVVLVGLLARNKFNANDVGLWIIPIVVGFGRLAGVINGLLNTKLRIPSFISTLGMSWALWGLVRVEEVFALIKEAWSKRHHRDRTTKKGDLRQQSPGRGSGSFAAGGWPTGSSTNWRAATSSVILV